MTDSLNFGPEWLRNLSSDGSTGGGTGGMRYQLAEFRYGREDMLALFDKTFRPPNSLSSFSTLYSEQALLPLAFQPSSEEERAWPTRAPPVGVSRGRGGSLERGGRGSRGRGSYQPYGRSGGFETGGGWGNSEQSEWSPRKDYNSRSSSVDNWRRNRGDEDEGWRSNNNRISEKWGRSTSWRDGDTNDDRGPQDRNRNWHDGPRSNIQRRMWDNDDNLPEWATENLGEGGGTFDASGAFHGSDDEMVENKITESDKKESPLQKSSSQQNMTQKKHPATLPSSKSSLSLSKPPEEIKQEPHTPPDMMETKITPKIKPDSKDTRDDEQIDIKKQEVLHKEKLIDISVSSDSNGISNEISVNNRVEEDFDRLQEDLVLKIVEEPSKSPHVNNASQIEVGLATQPPPNLAAPVLEKWFYQDPQGDLQGPFSSSEMAEWFRAGYFTVSLLVRRQCDERFYMLGDLVQLCNGNPFQTTMRIAPLKHETQNDILQLQMLQTQLALRQANARPYPQGEPWSGLSSLQQRELLSQQLIPQPQMPTELQFMPPANPLLQMFQMNQANKNMQEKPPNPLPVTMDPIQALVQQMGGLQSLQNRLPNNVGLPNNSTMPPSSVLPSSNVLPVTGNIPGNANLSTNPSLSGMGLQNDTLPSSLPGLHNPMPPSGLPIPNLQNLPGGLTGNMQNSLPTKPTLNKVDTLNDNNPINNLLRQFANKSQSQQREALWQQNQFVPSQLNPQWQQQQQPQPQDVPISMWDMQMSNLESKIPLPTSTTSITDDTKLKELKKDTKDINKEEKKKKELEEKLAKKETEEKRKQEQRKQEAEKKAAEEKRKREEERIKKELEKAKKEAEEKRLRELEEKRKLKELRRAEEEARKKLEEIKRIEEQERRETREKEETSRKQIETTKYENHVKLTKAAPWSHSNNTHGASLADIQKAEREKRAEQVALIQQQQQQQKLKQEQELVVEKPFNSHFSWANKSMAPKQVKSLAEIQAEEQEKLAKQFAEARLAQQQKEKETAPVLQQGIWNGQNLTWANNTSQWSNSGFWDGPISEKVTNKVSNVQKSSSASTTSVNQQQKQIPKQPVKNKVKKEQEVIKLNNNNNSVNDDFMNWCTKSLSALNPKVDIPIFVNFLRDIESALDVREYCRDYLGDEPATHQFASQFLEKRRSFKPKINAHKDDMCSPAPAITPSSHNDFTEVKAKGKKTKKSKMLKVDSRILGFNVTASRDRINVGDRDYVDN